MGIHSRDPLSNVIRLFEHIGRTQMELEPEEIVDAEEELPYFEYRAQRSKEGRNR
jgi:hypothetical protein